MQFVPILDKVRFTFKCKGVDDFVFLEKILVHNGYTRPNDIFYNLSINKFYHNVWYTKGESTVYIGHGFNSFENYRDFGLGVMEINPQKTAYFLLKKLMTVAKPFEVKRFDIASDYENQTFANLVYQTRADVMTYGTTSNYTLYIAPKSRSGRVKIYRKDLERKNDNQPPIIRVEMSVNKSCVDYVSHAERLCGIGFLVATPDELLLAHVPDDIRRAYLASVSRPTRTKMQKALRFNADMINIDAMELQALCEHLLLPYYKRGKLYG